MSVSLRHTYRFGEFVLDAEERRLLFSGRAVALRPKPFETLLYLARHPGHLVTKTELLDEVWTDRVVTEGALTRCIKEVRRALHDNPRAPQYIETRVGMGYTFVAAVDASEEAERPSSIAILPIIDLSPGHRLECFTDGLTEELAATLTRLPGLHVVNGTPSTAGGPGKPGRHLGVDAVLKGSVRSRGRRLRITVQLVDAESGYHLWSQLFDLEMGDPLAVQEEISARVAKRLGGWDGPSREPGRLGLA